MGQSRNITTGVNQTESYTCIQVKMLLGARDRGLANITWLRNHGKQACISSKINIKERHQLLPQAREQIQKCLNMCIGMKIHEIIENYVERGTNFCRRRSKKSKHTLTLSFLGEIPKTIEICIKGGTNFCRMRSKKIRIWSTICHFNEKQGVTTAAGA